MARQWAYTYTGSDLTSAKDPMGNVTSYAYGAGSTGNPLNGNNLLTITSADAQPGGPDAGDATINVYDAAGRVTQQTDPAGITTTFNYCVNAADGDCMNSSTGTGFVTVTMPGRNPDVYGYVQGALASQVVSDNSSVVEYDFGPALTAGGPAGATLLNLWSAGPGGAKSAFAYNAAGQETGVTDPMGNVSTAWPTSFGGQSCATDPEASAACSSGEQGPSVVAPGGAISPVTSAPPQGATFGLYDTRGNLLYSAEGIYPAGGNTASSVQADYTLYAGNSLTVGGANITCAAAPPAPSLPCATVDTAGVVTQFGYDPQGDLVSESSPDGNGSELATTTYAYDADGEETASTSADGNLAGANAGNYTTVTSYNNDGEVTAVIQAGGQGATVASRTTGYGYDGNGNQTSVTDPRGYSVTTAYSADDLPVLTTDPSGNQILTCHDEEGRIAQTVPAAGVAANHLTPASCPTAYPAGYGVRLAPDATTFTYHDLGNNTASTVPAPAGQSGYETITGTYDAAGDLTRSQARPPATHQERPISSRSLRMTKTVIC